MFESADYPARLEQIVRAPGYDNSDRGRIEAAERYVRSLAGEVRYGNEIWATSEMLAETAERVRARPALPETPPIRLKPVSREDEPPVVTSGLLVPPKIGDAVDAGMLDVLGGLLDDRQGDDSLSGQATLDAHAAAAAEGQDARSAKQPSVTRDVAPAGPGPLSGQGGPGTQGDSAAEGSASPEVKAGPSSSVNAPAGSKPERKAPMKPVNGGSIALYQRHGVMLSRTMMIRGEAKGLGKLSVPDADDKIAELARNERDWRARDARDEPRADEHDRQSARLRAGIAERQRLRAQQRPDWEMLSALREAMIRHGAELVENLPADVLDRVPGFERQAS